MGKKALRDHMRVAKRAQLLSEMDKNVVAEQKLADAAHAARGIFCRCFVKTVFRIINLYSAIFHGI